MKLPTSDEPEDAAPWQAFAARVKLTFPFRVDVLIEHNDDGSRVIMAVELHVLERSTRQPIQVKTRRMCGPWRSEAYAEETLFDLLNTAFEHEINESVWIDGKLSRELHRQPPEGDAPRRCAGCPAHIPIGAPSIYCEDCRNPKIETIEEEIARLTAPYHTDDINYKKLIK